MRPLEIRVRDEGGDWSEWVETHGGDPIYVGGADEAQVRAAFRPRGDLHFVNVSGTAGGLAETLLRDARGAINSAFISVASGSVAEAAAPKPKMVSRAAWGATSPRVAARRGGPPSTARCGPGSSTTPSTPTSTRARRRRGSCSGSAASTSTATAGTTSATKALLDRFGRVYKGRAGGMGAAVVGAQAQGFNSQTTAIASIGDQRHGQAQPQGQRRR